MLTVRQLEGIKYVLHSCFSLILTYKAEILSKQGVSRFGINVDNSNPFYNKQVPMVFSILRFHCL